MAVAQIAASSRELGFFYVVNHGVPADLVKGQLDWAEDFFALSDDAKAQIDIRRMTIPRGYEPVALQRLQDGAQPDQKEAFSFNREALGANQWPAPAPSFDAAAFRRHMETYRDAMEGLGSRICGLLAEALGLATNHFAEALDDPSVQVRLLHYPPQPSAAPADRLGCGAHTDWGLITILLQDDCGGLEIEAGDAWLQATPVEGAFIVNLGDMVVRMTSGGFASNVHRVINRAPIRHRYSVATFFNPPGDYVVETLPGFAAAAETPPIRFNDHIRAMEAKTYA
jgi:isopenicillin N synthase-like dioxygenase